MTQLYDITHSIADNDAKGTNGIGTIHRITVKGNDVDEKLEYGIVELINKLVDPQQFIQQYVDHNKAMAVERAAFDEKIKAAAKHADLEARRQHNAIPAEFAAIIDQIIAANGKAVAEWKSGKEKAINAIVGQVIGAGRKNQLHADPMIIQEAVIKCIG
jgi:Asp-tRNA(Asn)/Glu-tRNA(Gln) amidotransferase B subunit